MNPRTHPRLQLLHGNPSKRPIEAVGIEVGGQPFIPEHLDDDARGCVEVIVQMMPPGIFCPFDSFPLAAYAALWSAHKRACEEISAPGFQRSIGSRQAPAVRTMIQAAGAMASLGARLGLDPAGRAAIRPPSAPKQKSKFDGLIGRTGLNRTC